MAEAPRLREEIGASRCEEDAQPMTARSVDGQRRAAPTI
jgi:hypothetical protein